MHPDIVNELAFGLKLDNALCAAECADGQIPPTAEILSLAAAAHGLYISLTLESRSLGRIDDCRGLWWGAAQLFNDLCDSWIPVDIQANPDIQWLKNRLEHFRSLALDRAELYMVNANDRLEFAKTKEADFAGSHQ